MARCTPPGCPSVIHYLCSVATLGSDVLSTRWIVEVWDSGDEENYAVKKRVAETGERQVHGSVGQQIVRQNASQDGSWSDIFGVGKWSNHGEF